MVEVFGYEEKEISIQWSPLFHIIINTADFSDSATKSLFRKGDIAYVKTKYLGRKFI